MSAQFDTLNKRWKQGRISIDMLRKYVEAGRISEEEFKEITGEDFK